MGAINLAEAKAHLSELLSKAAGGEETIITRRGRPVAKLVPLAAPKKPVCSLAAFRATLAGAAAKTRPKWRHSNPISAAAGHKLGTPHLTLAYPAATPVCSSYRLSRIAIKAPPMIAVMAPLGVGRNGRFERCAGWGKAGANASAKLG